MTFTTSLKVLRIMYRWRNVPIFLEQMSYEVGTDLSHMASITLTATIRLLVFAPLYFSYQTFHHTTRTKLTCSSRNCDQVSQNF